MLEQRRELPAIMTRGKVGELLENLNEEVQRTTKAKVLREQKEKLASLEQSDTIRDAYVKRALGEYVQKNPQKFTEEELMSLLAEGQTAAGLLGLLETMLDCKIGEPGERLGNITTFDPTRHVPNNIDQRELWPKEGEEVVVFKEGMYGKDGSIVKRTSVAKPEAVALLDLYCNLERMAQNHLHDLRVRAVRIKNGQRYVE